MRALKFPTERSAGLTTWKPPDRKETYSVILAPDFGVTQEGLEAWQHYREQLGQVKEVFVSFSGIPGLPYSEHDLARFVALGSEGAGLALSGLNCGYGGEGPHGTAKVLRELGISEAVVALVFAHQKLRFVRLEDGWLAEIGEEEEP